MTGKQLQDRIKICGMKQKDIADALGISPQSLTSIFRADSVKTDTLEELARIVSRPIAWFYGDSASYISASADGANITGDNNTVGSILGELAYYGTSSSGVKTVTIPVSVLNLLQQQLQEKDTQIASLIRAVTH